MSHQIAVSEWQTDASYGCEKERKTSWLSVLIYLAVRRDSVFLSTQYVKGVPFIKRYTKGVPFL